MEDEVEKIRTLAAGLSSDLARLKTLQTEGSLKADEEMVHTVMPSVIDLAAALGDFGESMLGWAEMMEDHIGDDDIDSRLLPEDADLLRSLLTNYGALVEHSLGEGQVEGEARQALAARRLPRRGAPR